jgi:hypothetical protein
MRLYLLTCLYNLMYDLCVYAQIDPVDSNVDAHARVSCSCTSDSSTPLHISILRNSLLQSTCIYCNTTQLIIVSKVHQLIGCEVNTMHNMVSKYREAHLPIIGCNYVVLRFVMLYCNDVVLLLTGSASRWFITRENLLFLVSAICAQGQSFSQSSFSSLMSTVTSR